jgi:hypothetical protein
LGVVFAPIFLSRSTTTSSSFAFLASISSSAASADAEDPANPLANAGVLAPSRARPRSPSRVAFPFVTSRDDADDVVINDRHVAVAVAAAHFRDDIAVVVNARRLDRIIIPCIMANYSMSTRSITAAQWVDKYRTESCDVVRVRACASRCVRRRRRRMTTLIYRVCARRLAVERVRRRRNR